MTVIFSKDRAMQLDALLRSMQRYAPRLLPAWVLFDCSNGSHKTAYRILRQEYSALHWYYQGSLDYTQRKTSLRTCLLLAFKADKDAEQVTFLVDDDLFFRELPEFELPCPGDTFSSRLGKNCTRCYYSTDAWADFAYSTSLDGQTYRVHDILPCIERTSFEIPNDLESGLWNDFRQRFHLRYAEHSCLVGIPHNRVQDKYCSSTSGGTAEELNSRFLIGERLDLEAMDFSNVCAAHQDIPYRFRKGA